MDVAASSNPRAPIAIVQHTSVSGDFHTDRDDDDRVLEGEELRTLDEGDADGNVRGLKSEIDKLFTFFSNWIEAI